MSLMLPSVRILVFFCLQVSLILYVVLKRTDLEEDCLL